MDPLEALERLADQARKEAVPDFDVSARVLASVGDGPARRVLPLSLFAAVSAVAASIILAVGIYSLLAEPDPLALLAAPLQGTVLW